MPHRTPLILLCLAVASCAVDKPVEHRGDAGRTGHYGNVGIAALDQIAWKTRLEAPVAVPPAVGHNHVYVVDTAGVLTALAAADGAAAWSVELGAASHAPPVLTGRRIVVGSDAGLHAVSLEGEALWTYAAAPVETAALIIDGVAYVGTRDHRIMAVDVVGGTLIWTATAAGPVVASGARAGSDVIFGAGDGHVYRLDAATGEPRWSWQAAAPIWGVAVVGDRVLVTVGTELVALDAAAGTKALWRVDVGARVETPPAVSGDLVFAATGRGQLVGADIDDGAVTVRKDLGLPVRGDISLAADRVTVPQVEGIFVVDRTGKELWKFRGDGRVVGVVPASGVVYVADAQGSVYALR